MLTVIAVVVTVMIDVIVAEVDVISVIAVANGDRD